VEWIEVAARLRLAHGGKRAGKRRPARNRRKRRLSIFALVCLTVFILGFLAKRVMIPSAVHYIAYRPPDHPQPPTEQLTPNDRKQLDTILKEKNKP
jgi:hypothetical protein